MIIDTVTSHTLLPSLPFFTFFTSLRLFLSQQLSPFLICNISNADQLVPEELVKLLNRLKIKFLAILRILPSHRFGVIPAAVARLLAVHEADSRQDQASHVPGRGPSFLVVVREGGADGQVSLKSAGRRKEEELRRVERIIFMQLEEPVVNTPGVGSIEVMEAEMKVEMALARDQRVGYGLAVEHGLFLHQALHGQLVSLAHRKKRIIITSNHHTSVKDGHNYI